MFDAFRRGLAGPSTAMLLALCLAPRAADAQDAKAQAAAPAPEPTQFSAQPFNLFSEGRQAREMAFSPDGEHLAVSYGDPSAPSAVCVWNVAAGTTETTVQAPGGAASLCFSPNGKLLAFAGWEGSLNVRRYPSMEIAWQVSASSTATHLAFSPDGTRIATASESGEVQMWNAATGRHLKTFRGDRLFFANAVRFSPDGTTLVAAGGDNEQSASYQRQVLGQINVWIVDTGDFIGSLKGHRGRILALDYLSDGKTLISSCEDGRVRLWNMETGDEQTAFRGHQGPVLTAAFSVDGKSFVTIGVDQTLRTWEIARSRETASLTSQSGVTRAAAISPGARFAATSSDDSAVMLWNLEAGKLAGKLERAQSPVTSAALTVQSVAWSPNGRWLAAAREKTLLFYDAESGKLLEIPSGHDDVISHVAFSSDSRQLATSSFDRTLRLWEITARESEPGAGETSAADLEIKPGRILAGHTNWVFSACFSPDGRTLASSAYDKSIRLWNLQTPEAEPVVLPGHTASVRSVAFSPDGKLLASGSADRTVRLWDVATKEPIVLKGHTDIVRTVIFSPDGQRLASAGEDKVIRLWDVPKKTLLRQFPGHSGLVWCLAFSGSGRMLASGSFDNTIRLWETETGRSLQVLSGHADVVTGLAFAPDMRTLLSGSRDKSLRLWPARLPAR